MGIEQLQHKKGWNYMKKSEKISQYLKDKIKDYPSKLMEKDLFLAECSYDLGFKKSDFESYLNIMEQLGIVEFDGTKIISVQAKSRGETKSIVSDAVEEIMK